MRKKLTFERLKENVLIAENVRVEALNGNYNKDFVSSFGAKALFEDLNYNIQAAKENLSLFIKNNPIV